MNMKWSSISQGERLQNKTTLPTLDLRFLASIIYEKISIYSLSPLSVVYKIDLAS